MSSREISGWNCERGNNCAGVSRIAQNCAELRAAYELDGQLRVVELCVMPHPRLAQVRREAVRPLGLRVGGRRRVQLPFG